MLKFVFNGKQEKKKEAKDSAKVEKKTEELNLDLENRKYRTMKLTRYSGRLGDHYLTQDGKTLYYMVRLEKGVDLCKVNLEDNSISVVTKGVQGKLTFKVVKDAILNFTEGDAVRFRVNGANVFFGFVFSLIGKVRD